jgi:hypothetical protein
MDGPALLEQLGLDYRSPQPRALHRKDTTRRLVIGGPFNGRRVDAPSDLKVFEIGALLTHYTLGKDGAFHYTSIVNARRNEKECPLEP